MLTINFLVILRKSVNCSVNLFSNRNVNSGIEWRCGIGRSTTCHSRADIVFVVDSSGSINEQDPSNWDRVKNFAKSIVAKLDVGEDRVRVGMVEFGNRGWVQFYLNSHYNIPDITADIDRSVAPSQVRLAQLLT